MTTLNTQNILTALTASVLHSSEVATATLTNSQKNYQLTLWVRQSISENRLSEFFTMVEEAINALPSGKITTKTFHPVTGETLTKSVKYREIAKRSVKAAWKNAVKSPEFEIHQKSVLEFKLSKPQLKSAPAEKTLADKLAGLLGDTISGTDLDNIVLMVEVAQTSQAVSIATLAQNYRDREANMVIEVDTKKLIGMGISNEVAIDTIAGREDMDYDDVEKIVFG